MKINEAVALYIQMRDKKAEMKAGFDAQLAGMQEKLDKLEVKLLAAFQTLGVDSVKTEAGTAYTTTRSSASVVDKDAFFDFVRQKEEWSLLEVRCAKLAVEQYTSAHGELPPGVNTRNEVVVNVRRSS